MKIRNEFDREDLMQTKNDKSIYKQLLHIVAPISFQYLMASFVSASDAFMLGFLD